jgi:hypothetical protein
VGSQEPDPSEGKISKKQQNQTASTPQPDKTEQRGTKAAFCQKTGSMPSSCVSMNEYDKVMTKNLTQSFKRSND